MYPSPADVPSSSENQGL
jgi:hypothetical protein